MLSKKRHARFFSLLTLASITIMGLQACGSGSTTNSAEPTVNAATPAPNLTASSSAQSDFIQVATKAINEVRAKEQLCGAVAYPAQPAVKWNDAVANAAALESAWMQSHNTFSHSWTDGTGPGERLKMANYPWKNFGENIAAGQSDVAQVVAAWVASPGHCANIMRAGVVDMGLSKVDGTSANQYPNYWTLVVAGS
jgi:uncharacterized protein YkwD